MNKRVYFDYAAATPLDKSVSRAMQKVEPFFANPSSNYQSGREAAKTMSQSKKTLGMQMGANADEIVLTSGATEANNLAIIGSMQNYKDGEIITIATEHSSVREPLSHLHENNFEIIYSKISKTGKLDLTQFERNLSIKTRLVTIAYANSEIGTVQKLSKISQIIKKFNTQNNTNILFHSDCSAAIGSLNCDVSRLGLDMATFSAAKIYGPKGIGMLYIKRGTKVNPILFGGGQQSGLRSGSEGLALTVGFAEAMKLAVAVRKNEAIKYKEMYIKLIHQLQEKLTFIENGDAKDRIFNIANISFEGLDGENLVAYLDSQGIEVSTGAACEASNDKPSEVLLSLGLSESQAQGSLRISFGRPTTHKDIDFLIEKLIGIISS